MQQITTCRYCPLLNTSGSFISKGDNLTYKSKININCQTCNCIYLILCSNCGTNYVGQTKKKLLARFNSLFLYIFIMIIKVFVTQPSQDRRPQHICPELHSVTCRYKSLVIRTGHGRETLDPPIIQYCPKGSKSIRLIFSFKVRQHLCRAVSRNSRFLTIYNRVLVMYISI